MKPNYDITKRTTLINDTFQLMCHLHKFDFAMTDEVDEGFLQMTKAIIESDTDTIWQYVDIIQEDMDYIQCKDFDDADRAFYLQVLTRLRKLASGDWSDDLDED